MKTFTLSLAAVVTALFLGWTLFSDPLVFIGISFIILTPLILWSNCSKYD